MYTPDKGGRLSRTLPGVFCCSRKGQAMPVEGSRRDFQWAAPAGSGEAFWAASIIRSSGAVRRHSSLENIFWMIRGDDRWQIFSKQ